MGIKPTGFTNSILAKEKFMANAMNKIKMTLEALSSARSVHIFNVDGLKTAECEPKTSNIPPEDIEYKEGSVCNKRLAHFWIKGEFDTPPCEENSELYIHVDNGATGWDALNPQALLYLNGKMVEGIDVNHKDHDLSAESHYELSMYWYTAERDYFSVKCSIRKLYLKVEELYYDMLVPYEACRDVYPCESAEYQRTLSVIEQTANILDLRAIHSDEFFKSVDSALSFIKSEYYEKLCSTEGKPVVNCIGHTHIDVEWRWTRFVTRDKIQCSFTTAKSLMDKYPEYKFMLSQPELYRYLKEEAPEKYEELKELIKNERWEPEGAMYVECDCNLTSGESLVRQIMYGTRFFKREFGTDCHTLFLPDVFGYSAALPQILKKSGIDYFITSKISWNDTNTLPHDTFIWQGIDGTEIFTNFITGQKYNKSKAIERRTTYIGRNDPDFIYGTWARQTDKAYVSSSLNTFGYGDGGGGPTKEMLEKLRRLSKGLPGFPVTKTQFIYPYLKQLEAEFNENAKKLRSVPKWIGELYLEFHRGTYTTMANNKRGNRRSEFGMQKCEALSVTDLLHGGSYDKAAIDDAWVKILHNQFHDILPGSSIKAVYDISEKDYLELEDFTRSLANEKIKALAARVGTDGGIFVYNALGFPRHAEITLGGKHYITDEEIPALGWAVITPTQHAKTLKVASHYLENEFYRIEFDSLGRFSSVFDKRVGRNIISAPANEIRISEDRPHEYDGWELEHDYATKTYVPDKIADEIIIDDGDRVGIKYTRKYLRSEITQTIWIYSSSPRIDIENEVDWQEKHQIMKLAFPFDVHASSATFEIQYGHTSRPNHKNTSWDEAKFEVCAHKWVDISETGYGVSVLNDSKYGFSANEGTITVSCLRAPTFPNENADICKHKFTISLLPHLKSFAENGVIREAYSINQPIEYVEIGKQNGTLPERYSLVSCDEDAIVIECAKRAEDSDDLIVRLYESHNSHTTAHIHTAENFSHAYLTDLTEKVVCELEIKDGTVTLPMKNFAIETLRFVK